MGVSPFVKAYVLDNLANDDRAGTEENKMSVAYSTEALPILLLDDRISLDGVSIKRMPDKRGCSVCNRGSHLQFKRTKYWGWRKCRKHLSPNEKALLFLMLTETEAGGLTD